jgi:probable rRNA maturation factor
MAGPPERTRAIYRPPWRVDLTLRAGVSAPISGGALAGLVGRALDAAGAPPPASIGLILSDDAELATLNEEHMGAVGATDVLSFPLLPPETFPPRPGRTLGAGPPSFPLPPGSRIHLGDIVISIERAHAQAAEGRGGQTGDVAWDVADEVRLLAVHGVLHVCGWDHAEPVEGDAMRALERTLLAGQAAP